MNKQSDGYNKVAVVLAFIAAFIALWFIGSVDASQTLIVMEGSS